MADTRRMIGEGIATFSNALAQQLLQNSQNNQLAQLLKDGDVSTAVQGGIPIETALKIAELQKAQEEAKVQQQLRQQYFQGLKGDQADTNKSNAGKIGAKYRQKMNANGKITIERVEPKDTEEGKLAYKEKELRLKKEIDQEYSQDITEQINKVRSAFGDNIPVGTSLKIGDLTIPLNPKATESEAAAISGVQALDPIVSKIEAHLDAGVLDSSSDIFRTAKQAAADSQNALLTSMSPELQALQSDLNTLKKTLPFTEGGKQLTNTEKQLVFALLNVIGKSNKQIKNDLRQALQILRNKEKIALGGKSALSDNPSSISSDFDRIYKEVTGGK